MEGSIYYNCARNTWKILTAPVMDLSHAYFASLRLPRQASKHFLSFSWSFIQAWWCRYLLWGCVLGSLAWPPISHGCSHSYTLDHMLLTSTNHLVLVHIIYSVIVLSGPLRCCLFVTCREFCYEVTSLCTPWGDYSSSSSCFPLEL